MGNDYYPIRRRMLWVGIINAVVGALALAGVGADVLNGWAAWGIGVLDLLVMAGILVRGTTDAETNTIPIDSLGVPLNPEYTRSGS